MTHFASYEQARDGVRDLRETLKGIYSQAQTPTGLDLMKVSGGLAGDTPEKRHEALLTLERQAEEWNLEWSEVWVPRQKTQQWAAEEAVREGAIVPSGADVDPAYKGGGDTEFKRLAAIDWSNLRTGAAYDNKVELSTFDLLGGGIRRELMEGDGRRGYATTVQPVGGTFESGLAQVGGVPLQIANVLAATPKMPVSTGTVAWIEITTQVNAAAGRAVGAAAVESTLTPTKRTATIVNTAHLLPVADEVYDDSTWANAYIPTQFRALTENAVDRDILLGDGTANKLTGFDNIADGIPDATARAASNPPPAAEYIGEQIGVVEGTNLDGGPVTHLVERSQEWWKMRVDNDNGRWPFGDPGMSVGKSVLGLTVIPNNHLGEGVGFLLTLNSFNVALALRDGGTVEASQHAKWAEFSTVLRGQIRCYLVPFRRKSWIKISGLQN